MSTVGDPGGPARWPRTSGQPAVSSTDASRPAAATRSRAWPAAPGMPWPVALTLGTRTQPARRSTNDARLASTWANTSSSRGPAGRAARPAWPAQLAQARAGRGLPGCRDWTAGCATAESQEGAGAGPQARLGPLPLVPAGARGEVLPGDPRPRRPLARCLLRRPPADPWTRDRGGRGDRPGGDGDADAVGRPPLPGPGRPRRRAAAGPAGPGARAQRRRPPGLGGAAVHPDRAGLRPDPHRGPERTEHDPLRQGHGRATRPQRAAEGGAEPGDPRLRVGHVRRPAGAQGSRTVGESGPRVHELALLGVRDRRQEGA